MIKILTRTPYSQMYQLRFQGVNLEGADLSYLDLRNTNFKHANMPRVNLTGANLSYCNMERANLSNSLLDVITYFFVPALIYPLLLLNNCLGCTVVGC